MGERTVERVARELAEKWKEAYLVRDSIEGIGSSKEYCWNAVARYVLASERAALERAADELETPLRERYGKDIPETYARICNEACGFLRRLAAEIEGR